VKRSIVVAALGTAQTLAWGSSYYLPAILADPIAQGLGLSRTTVFGLFSGALLLSAVLGPSVGRAIDNRGGRGVLALSNLVLAAGLVLLGVAQAYEWTPGGRPSAASASDSNCKYSVVRVAPR
jgi:nitrate/nitrite transporter NarK